MIREILIYRPGMLCIEKHLVNSIDPRISVSVAPACNQTTSPDAKIACFFTEFLPEFRICSLYAHIIFLYYAGPSVTFACKIEKSP